MLRYPDWRKQWRLSTFAMVLMTEVIMKTWKQEGISANAISRVNMFKD